MGQSHDLANKLREHFNADNITLALRTLVKQLRINGKKDNKSHETH
jgi:hypothetical protein